MLVTSAVTPGAANDHPRREARLAAGQDQGGQAVLARDAGLRVVQSGKLACGQAAFGFQPQVTQAGAAGKCTRRAGHGSPSPRALGPLTPGGKDSPQLP